MGWIAIIPARGGSKGIAGKNLAICGGKSLLARSAEVALASGCFVRVILSTDSEEIAAAGRDCGLDVPWLRPRELARDETPMLPVVRHVVTELEKTGERIDGIVLLQPTSPMRRVEHIREAVKLAADPAFDAVVSVVEVPHAFNPYSVLRRGSDGTVANFIESPGGEMLRRQDKPKVFARNGPAILALKRAQIDRDSFYSGRTHGYVMSAMDSIDIDGPEDLKLAERLLATD